MYIKLVCPFSNDRLLYFMLMRYRNCGHCLPADELSLDYIIYTLCALIQHERNLIIEMDIPNALRDLFLEQSKIDTVSSPHSQLETNLLTEIKCVSTQLM